MALNDTPSANRIHIAFFGKRNVGKSSLVNAITGQNLCVVSNVKGTTTDPVSKAMELLPIGPVLIIDTPGLDDEGEIGKLRADKAKEILNRTDIAVLVIDSSDGKESFDKELIATLENKSIPYLVVYSKCDLKLLDTYKENEIAVSAKENININKLKKMIAKLAELSTNEKVLLKNKINKNDIIVLVTPIDESAPKGRIILPQVQTIRRILDSFGICITVQPEQFEYSISLLKVKPKLVICDSQVFAKIKDVVANDVFLTSFSVIFAHFKGILKTAVEGAMHINNLKDGDTVLISEGCTHHRQCNDIGSVKLPMWIEKFSCKNLKFKFTSGKEFPKNLADYELIVHCGGCMLNEREMIYRMNLAKQQKKAFTNYGAIIAHMNGILKRSIELFDDIIV